MMKTVIYSFLALYIFSMVATSFTFQSKSKTSILIQPVDMNVSAPVLSQAAGIISARLKDFSSDKYEIKIIPDKNQIQVVSENSKDLNILENLITKTGTMDFYETWSQKDLLELLKGDKYLFSLFQKSNPDISGARIGCISRTEFDKVTEYLSTLRLNKKCKFTWSSDFGKPDICLFALKPDSKDAPVLNKSDIESAKYLQDKIDIKLKKQAIAIWAEVTRRNMNNEIALVLDNNVISYPRVRSVIESGEIEITGSFSQAEAGYIASMLNNGELPVNFRIIK